MANAKLALLALAVALAALGIVLLGPDRSREVAAARPDDERSIAGLVARLSALEQRNSGTGETIEAAASTPTKREPLPAAPLASPTDPAVDAAELERRLERLEARAWSLEELAERGFRVVRVGLDEPTLRKWSDRARNTELSELERVEALGRLRGQFWDDGSDARLGILASMLELASSDQPEVRAGVWRHLSGLTDSSMRAPLLASLARDASPEVRGCAADVLRAFLPDPDVEAALLGALQLDPDEGVKDAAFLAAYGQPRGPR